MVVISLGCLATDAIQIVGREIVNIDELNAGGFNYFAVPTTITVIAPFDVRALAVVRRTGLAWFWPDVAWRQTEKNRGGSLLAGIVNELAQIPTEAIDGQILPVTSCL